MFRASKFASLGRVLGDLQGEEVRWSSPRGEREIFGYLVVKADGDVLLSEILQVVTCMEGVYLASQYFPLPEYRTVGLGQAVCRARADGALVRRAVDGTDDFTQRNSAGQLRKDNTPT